MPEVQVMQRKYLLSILLELIRRNVLQSHSQGPDLVVVWATLQSRYIGIFPAIPRNTLMIVT